MVSDSKFTDAASMSGVLQTVTGKVKGMEKLSLATLAVYVNVLVCETSVLKTDISPEQVIAVMSQSSNTWPLSGSIVGVKVGHEIGWIS